MQRDGARESLWQHNQRDYANADKKIEDKIYDVLIVGGGITGVSVAYLLQKNGMSCVLAEGATIGFGTTGGTTAHLNTIMDTSYPEIEKKFSRHAAQTIADSAKLAIHFIETTAKTLDIDCDFEYKNGYLLANNDDQSKELDDIVSVSKEVGIEIDYTNKIPAPISFDNAAIIRNQAQFNPIKYLFGVADSFRSFGGVLLQNCFVSDVKEETEDTLLIATTRGKIRARKIVYATHIPPGVNLLHMRCAPYRSYVLAVELENEQSYPDALIYDMEEPYNYYRTQEIEGKKYLIFGGKDHKTGHEENLKDRFHQLEQYLKQFFSIKSIKHFWSSQYFEPADGLPYIGNLPGHDGRYFVATGFGGNGMIYGTLAAFIMFELIVRNDYKYPLAELLDPNRLKLVAGFSNFVKEGADVAAKWLGGHLASHSIDNLASVSPGEAQVVKYNHEDVALYRDGEGKLHAVNPTCTHLQCKVKWNDAELSWDCPCHGARYSTEGKVITGPANRNLDYIIVDELVREHTDDTD
ncbi:FAD-dependent oxidoreductase [Chitinophagaceae bacterium 26-R-25]|nr:FAD-dependent oxidoreductase [Chitinophagaceae bacterium 26-R-25]